LNKREQDLSVRYRTMSLPFLTLAGLIFARMLGGGLFGLSMPSGMVVSDPNGTYLRRRR
jgi:hypothetical protein